ncbi:retropepsin-like aspartic protease [Tunicatimonas pelagia]|uniref:retropepsin-like aspartic protease n=1 Tax=Tunicatimonas pelagia TaxID=931531 RepID=UPI0026651FDE|nr:retropepsin-like aspartic protease [Tunicatimonas pelagia]WKN45798.1 retropepsin-like aspartic protease [Tunicatimonas pelagia]
MILLIIICFIWGSQIPLMAQDQYEVVELAVMRDQPIVRGKINGKKAYLLLDTGADVSIIHCNDAKRYGFSCHTRTSLRGFQLAGLGANVKGLVGVYDMDLQLGSQTIQANYIALDLSGIIRSLNTGASVKISGIIGSKALKRHGFVVDYDRKEVKMRLPGAD